MNQDYVGVPVTIPPLSTPCSEAEIHRGVCWRVTNPETGHVNRFYRCADCQPEEPWYEHGTGGEEYTRPDGSQLRLCPTHHRERRARWQDQAAGQPVKRAPIEIKLPPEYATASLDTVAPTFRKGVLRWPFEATRMMVKGRTGAGKTHICRAIQRTQAARGYNVTYLNMPSARELWFTATHEGDRSRLIDLWKRAIYLEMDEFNSPPITEAWQALILELLDHRINWQLATLVTVRVPDPCEKALELEAFKKAIISRLNLFEVVSLMTPQGKSVDWRRIVLQGREVGVLA